MGAAGGGEGVEEYCFDCAVEDLEDWLDGMVGREGWRFGFTFTMPFAPPWSWIGE